MTADWITNDPKIAAKLREIDDRYGKHRQTALGLGLQAKIKIYREARRLREELLRDL